jgi:hypothetical protein
MGDPMPVPLVAINGQLPAATLDKKPLPISGRRFRLPVTLEGAQMTDTPQPEPAYATPQPRKKGTPLWVFALIALAVLGLGTCVYKGVQAFGALSERGEASVELAKTFLTDGMANADDPIYSRRIEITQENIDQLNRFFPQFGAVSDYSDAACNMQSVANTDASKSGTFTTCTLRIEAEASPGTVTVTWVREDEMWKLFGFFVNYDSNAVLMEKAEKLDALEAEREAADQTE